jgi:hypothetical protein
MQLKEFTVITSASDTAKIQNALPFWVSLALIPVLDWRILGWLDNSAVTVPHMVSLLQDRLGVRLSRAKC